jgi:hypothetical protein
VFWGIDVVGFFGLALIVPVYTSCVPRGALRFFYKSSSYLSKKKSVLGPKSCFYDFWAQVSKLFQALCLSWSRPI